MGYGGSPGPARGLDFLSPPWLLHHGAYARHAERQLRRAIIGTTNSMAALPNDVTGNRRFVAVNIAAGAPADVRRYLDANLDNAPSGTLSINGVLGSGLPTRFAPVLHIARDKEAQPDDEHQRPQEHRSRQGLLPDREIAKRQ